MWESSCGTPGGGSAQRRCTPAGSPCSNTRNNPPHLCRLLVFIPSAEYPRRSHPWRSILCAHIRAAHASGNPREKGGRYDLLFLGNGLLSSGSEDKKIRIWDVTDAKCKTTLEGHGACVRSLAQLPDGRLASASEDGKVKVWDLAAAKCMATLEGHKSIVWALASTEGGQLISGTEDKTIKIWDVPAAKCIATLEGHRQRVAALVTLGGGQIASGSEDRAIRIWRA